MAAVARRAGQWTLHKTVEIVVEDLQSDDRLGDGLAIVARRQRRQRGRRLSVESLFAEVDKRELPQSRVGDIFCAPRPVLESGADKGRDGDPIADVGEQERLAHPRHERTVAK